MLCICNLYITPELCTMSKSRLFSNDRNKSRLATDFKCYDCKTDNKNIINILKDIEIEFKNTSSELLQMYLMQVILKNFRLFFTAQTIEITPKFYSRSVIFCAGYLFSCETIYIFRNLHGTLSQAKYTYIIDSVLSNPNSIYTYRAYNIWKYWFK